MWRRVSLGVAVLGLVLAVPIGVRGGLGAQSIPRDEYLRYVPLESPAMVRQTDASEAFHLFGDRGLSSYRDADPIDGIDDRRHQVLLDLAVRFAPYLVQNTTAIPMDFRRFVSGTQSAPLHVDTWEVAGATPQLVTTAELDWASLVQEPCDPPPRRSRTGSADCRLLALLDAFDPLSPGPARSIDPVSARFTVLYFDLPGDGPGSWQQEYDDRFSGRLARTYDDLAMISAHPFVVAHRNDADTAVGFEFVLQYWFFYPFNDGGNNHEGDWEHINVLITPFDRIGQEMRAEDIRRILDGRGLSDNRVDRLVIKRVDYYFHNRVFSLDYTHPNAYAARAAWEAEVDHTVQELLNEKWYWKQARYYAYWDDGETVVNTHPIAFIGGDNKGTDQLLSSAGGTTNRDSHGTFPFPALYKDIGPAGAAEQVTQRFDHRAYHARGGDARGLSEPRFRRGHAESFAYPDKILIVPDGERVVELVKRNAAARRDWAWLVLPVRWGYPAVRSPFAGVIAHAETGNLSPVGPSYNSGWNRVGAAQGYEAYLPHRFTPLVPGSWQDGFMNRWGWLNLTLPTVAVLPPFDLLNRFVIQPVRALFGRTAPTLIPTRDVPHQFVGLGVGASHMILDIDFVDLLVNEVQIDDILRSLTDFSAAIGDSIVGGGREFVRNAVAGYAQLNVRLGRRFTGENTLRHGFTDLGVDVTFPVSGELWALRARMNFWEYAGSLRYNFGTGGFMPFVKGGYGLSWYRIEDATTNGAALGAPDGPWVRRPTISNLVSLLPNTWHIGGGFEWVPIRSYAALPQGIDMALRGEVLLYFHDFGGRIPFGRPSSALTPGVLGELPQNPIITRPVFSLGLAIGL